MNTIIRTRKTNFEVRAIIWEDLIPIMCSSSAIIQMPSLVSINLSPTWYQIR